MLFINVQCFSERGYHEMKNVLFFLFVCMLKFSRYKEFYQLFPMIYSLPNNLMNLHPFSFEYMDSTQSKR